jgi:polyhydroxyalkanoate synthesis repressor PhaR
MPEGSMSQPKAPPPGVAGPQIPPVVVKKYANRRLYNTESSSYITLDNLAEMVRAGRDFVVYDAKTSDDITRSVLTQIIVEEESKGGAMLPTPFLRQLIGLYGGNLQGLVPRYLEQSMGAFAEQQQRLRSAVSQTMGTFMPPGFEEIGRQNMAMIERAMNLFTPFYRGDVPEGGSAAGSEAAGGASGTVPGGTQGAQGAGRGGAPAGGAQAADRAEIEALRAEVDTLRRQLAASRETKA